MTENLDHIPAPLDLDAAFRDRFITACRDAAAIKGEPTNPERIWAEAVRLMPDEGPWWESVHPADPDLYPDLSADETNDAADKEAKR